MCERGYVCLLRHRAKNIASRCAVQVHGAEVWVKVGRDMGNIVLKFFEHSTEEAKRKKKLIITKRGL